MDEENYNENYDLEEIMAEFRGVEPPDPGEAGSEGPAFPEDLPNRLLEPSAPPEAGWQGEDHGGRLVLKSISDAFAAGEVEPGGIGVPGAQYDAGGQDYPSEDAPEQAWPDMPSEPEPPPVTGRAAGQRPSEQNPPPAGQNPPPVAKDALPEPETGEPEALRGIPGLLRRRFRARDVEVKTVEDRNDAEYAAADAAEGGEEEPPQEEPPPKERKLSVLMALMALVALRRERRARGEAKKPTEETAAEPEEVPELAPKRAARVYGSQMGSLRLRGQVSAAVCLVMLYLSFAFYSEVLPLTGALANGTRAISMLLVILEATVVVIGLDVFTGGVLAIFRRRMGAESLVSVSCIFSLLDGVLLAYLDKPEYGLPFCAVSALSMCFAVWGAYYTCKGRRSGFRVLASARTVYTVTAERGLTEKNLSLLKSQGETKGFIRRTEEADPGEYAYGAVTPFLLIASVVLGLLSSLLRGQASAALHCISILAAVSATFSCTLCFSAPFSAIAQRLSQSGAAIAGWSGLREVGNCRYVVVTDGDVFPRGTVEIEKVRILEGAFTDKVISYSGSVIAASGSSLAEPFTDLIRRNGYTIRPVENFEAHEGGGMTAVVNGEVVLVGGADFMSLMGIRLPQKLKTASTIFTAISGKLVGLFQMAYRPVASVQAALVTLFHSKQEPLFAIRDFNITPKMIQRKFRMPTDDFKFPSYAERYQISGAEPSPESRTAAIIVRDGMGPMAEIADRGRQGLIGIRAVTVLSVVGSILGLLIMFVLCWLKAFDSANASNVLTFMLIWLVAELLIIAVKLR